MGEKGQVIEDMLKEPEEEEQGECSRMGLEEVEMGEDWGALVRIRGSLERGSRFGEQRSSGAQETAQRRKEW
jgi:hypothetical protein